MNNQPNPHTPRNVVLELIERVGESDKIRNESKQKQYYHLQHH